MNINRVLSPLILNNQTIGALEVIRAGDKPFDADSLELITTFGTQAAIAIDNARRYTQTDEKLRARLDELSVMQQIDRELNASLDVNILLDITLKWAMSQSKANAGLVGLLEDQRLDIRNLQGYPDDSDPTTIVEDDGNKYLELDYKNLLDVQKFSTPLLLDGGKGHVFLPIRRKGKSSAAVILESTETSFCPQDTLFFLSRLGDHAAIALSNAHLYSEVQQANQAKSEYITLVSHELKTPMTSIKGYAELISQGAAGPINDLQSNFLSIIRTNINRMAALVSDLTDISRIETGRLHLEFGAVDIHEVTSEVIHSLQSQFETKGQNVQVMLPEKLPLVWADRTRTIQVLTNLLSNAHKYSLENTNIQLSACESSNQWDPNGIPDVVLLRVEDKGLGISPEDQAKIFQKFFRSEHPKVRENTGTGLGLHITRSLIEMQGGKIWFESQIDQGTTFYFTVPVASS
jgi:signal transduction histidine kinase